MNRSLFVRNRQRTRPVNARYLRTLAQSLLQSLLQFEHYDLGIYLVEDPEMARLNERFLHHAGTTDVITFDYAGPKFEKHLHGEIFICLNEALRQARKYRVPWPAELARYLIHGVLHLCGFTDRTVGQRKVMKRQENDLLRKLARSHRLTDLRRAA